MNYNSFIKNQPDVVKVLNNAYNKNRLVHTYLFEGSKGTKKLEGAYYLASMILCSTDKAPCMKCDDCISVSKKTHPNLFYIEPNGGMIKKEQILSLEHEFSMTALSGEKRVFIINGIDKCNVQSANSLLKFLEEAHENCFGILITENLNATLPTIVSRSQVLHFKKVSKEAVYEELISNGVDDALSKILSNITNDQDGAMNIISDGIIIDIVSKVKEIGKSIILNSNSYLCYLDNLKDVLRSVSKESNIDYNVLFLDILALFMNDCIKKSLYDNDLIFTEINEIEEYIPSTSECVKLLEIVMKYKERLRYNINVELAFCEMFIELGGYNGKGSWNRI